MDIQQNESFTRATRGIAHKLLSNAKERVVNVETIEGLSTNLIKSLVKAHKDNSTEYTIKIKDRTNLWFDKEMSLERRKHRIAKHAYENAKHNPAKRAVWKDLESKVTNMANKKRKEKRQGKSNMIVT